MEDRIVLNRQTLERLRPLFSTRALALANYRQHPLDHEEEIDRAAVVGDRP
jgi:hypothetical protein